MAASSVRVFALGVGWGTVALPIAALSAEASPHSYSPARMGHKALQTTAPPVVPPSPCPNPQHPPHPQAPTHCPMLEKSASLSLLSEAATEIMLSVLYEAG